MRPSLALALTIAATAQSACFSPSLGDKPFVCGDNDPRCPSGYHCAADGFCWVDGQDPPPDAEPPIDASPPDAFICTVPGATSCDLDELLTCEGDAALSRAQCPFGCSTSSPAPHCRTLIPSNVDPSMVPEATCANSTGVDLIVPAAMTLTLSTDDDCDLTQPQNIGPELCILVRRDLGIAAGATLRAAGTRALVILVTRFATVDGTIDVSADHFTRGPGASDPSADGGNGDCGGAFEQPRRCGGGGAGHATAGAAGGPSTPGGGAPGGILGDASLIPLTAGGRGGTNADSNAARGANGGAVQISACGSLTLGANAIINAGGGGGTGGAGGDFTMSGSGGAGGGSGGAILLQAPAIMVATGANLAANGGAGGGGGGSVGGAPAPNGSPGQNGGLGTTAAVGGAAAITGAGVGGAGGAATLPQPGTAAGGDHGHGGGGGAVGRIRLDSQAGDSLDVSGAIISPTPTKGSATIE